MKRWTEYPELNDKDNLSALIEHLHTPLCIARHLGCSRESVKHAMKHHGLHTKKYHIGDEMKTRLRL